MSYCCFLLASISSGQLSKPRKAVQLRFLHKLCSPKSHRRQPVDCSVPSYRGHERFSGIPPAAAGGLFSPKLPRTRKILRNPTGGSRWIVQSQATGDTKDSPQSHRSEEHTSELQSLRHLV